MISCSFFFYSYFFSDENPPENLTESSPGSDQESSDVSDDADPDFVAQERRRGCGRGRARARGRGRPAAPRGRGRARGARARQVVPPVAAQPYKSYDDPDTGNQLPAFVPNRPPGLHLIGPVVRGAMTRAVDFFQLFFTDLLLQQICNHTNAYGWVEIVNKPYYADRYGAWKETTPEEIAKLIALSLYCGLVTVSSFPRYWSTKTLYHGLWARSIMSRDRFKALMGMLHVVDPATEDEHDKLRKVRSLLNVFKEKCKSLYQPFQNVAVDERMVKSKHRSGIRQYIKDKPTKWGIKLWVLADSANGYTYDFDVYTGRSPDDQPPSEHGLGYDVVMKLVEPLVNQGYHLYFDNFYSSPKLLKDLFGLGIPSCGTAAENRRGFPDCMKKGKEWARRKDRGTMRWVRDAECLALQWKDNRPVTMLTTIHNANEFVHIDRKQKIANRWQNVQVCQPKAIEEYNAYMNGVDRSDQIIGKSTALRKCMRWWKTLFFHMIDIAVVNGFILFQLRDVEELKRPQQYSTTEFREELVRQLAGLEEYGLPPAYNPSAKQPGDFEAVHMPKFGEIRRNCKVCYDEMKKELKVGSYCGAPQCQVYLHCTQKQNCFEVWHSKNYAHRK